MLLRKRAGLCYYSAIEKKINKLEFLNLRSTNRYYL